MREILGHFAQEIWNLTDTLVIVGAVGGLILFIFKTWMKSYIEAILKNRVENKIETLRSELRRAEEEFKNNLKIREAEISTLQNSVIGGRYQRLLLIDKRKLESLESIWKSVSELRPAKNLALAFKSIKIEELIKISASDSSARGLADDLLKSFISEQFSKIALPENERLFISEITWAYYNTYRTICSVFVFVVRAISAGLPNIDKLIDQEKIRSAIISAMPENKQFIEQYGWEGYPYLIEFLEQKLLSELKKK